MVVPGCARPGRWSRRFLAGAASCLCVSLVLVTLPQQAAGQEGTDCETSHFDATEVPAAIPDPGSVTSSLVVPEGKRVDRAAVSVSVSHPFVSDLRLELVSPQGKRVLLAEAVGMWGDDLSGTTFSDQATTSILSSLPPFSGQHLPVETLAAFSGSARAGTWTLKVTDLRARYSGTIESWSLDLVSCAEATSTRQRAGAPEPPPLPDGVPVGSEPVEGRLITVTTTSEVSNGDVSTVSALEASPGPDGISLREAIEATNNDPGTYTVHFDSSLTGAPIGLVNVLPVLTGGGVFIDGDIDSDGVPDVTLVDQSEGGVDWGLNLASSGNRVHALGLRGFRFGVVFTAMRSTQVDAPLLEGQTYARNVVSGLVLEDIAASIAVHPTQWHQECQPETPCRTASTWLDTRIVGNTIGSDSFGGIWLGWINDSGDAQERVTVASNRIRIGNESVGIGISEGKAIDVSVGYAGLSDNRISDALVAYNAFELGGRRAIAIQVLAGQQGRSGNVVEDVRVVGNRVRFTGDTPGYVGVVLAVSDDCWPPASGAPCDNFVRRVDVVRNVVEGLLNRGVVAGDPCCGGGTGKGSRLTDLLIADNVIDATIPPDDLNPWGVVIGGGGGARVSRITVIGNSIDQHAPGPRSQYAARLAGAAIAVLNLGMQGGAVQDVVVSRNRLDTQLLGISIVGGGPSDEVAAHDAIRNRVFDVRLRRNKVVQKPVLATRWYPKAKGITVIGGLGGPPPPTGNWRRSKFNSVACIKLTGNIVVTKSDVVAVFANLGRGASQNTARLRGC